MNIVAAALIIGLGIIVPTIVDPDPLTVTKEDVEEVLKPELPPTIEFNEPDLEIGFGREEYEAAMDTVEDSIGDSDDGGGACTYGDATMEREPIIREHLWSDSVIVTHYCPGPCCCGQWASGYTASGTLATAGRTVACGDLPFGTKIRIEGLDGIYVVEDRGVNGFWIDIFCDSHQEALQRGMYTTRVWIVEE